MILNEFEAGTESICRKSYWKRHDKNPKDGVKILGDGELKKKFTVKANAFSKSAIEKIEAAGGKAEVI